MELLVLLAIPAAIVAWIWTARYWGRIGQRRNEGRCLNCGYDLRASIGRCPECGHAVERPAVESADASEPSARLTPIATRRPAANEHEICAFETMSRIEAASLAEQLTMGGVVCRIQAAPPANQQEPPKQRLMIWSEDGPRAEEILNAIRRRTAQVRSGQPRRVE